jgi:hypothetical protein
LPLDILGTRGEQHYTPHQLAPLDTTGLHNAAGADAAGPDESDTESKTPTSADPFRDTPLHERYRGFSRLDSSVPSPTVLTAPLGFAQPGASSSTPSSPTAGTFTQSLPKQGTFSSFGMGRHASQEALLQISPSSPLSPIHGPRTYNMGSASSRMRPSALRHETAAENVSELKRDTLAYLGEEQGSSRGRSVTAPMRSREEDEAEMEYVVHRDAGRRVMELPPRYEELNWDGQEPTTSPVALSTGSVTPTRLQHGTESPATSPTDRFNLRPPPSAHSVPLPPSPTVPSGPQVTSETGSHVHIRESPV